MRYRGVILAGGKGTRLGELTRAVNKHLLPVGPIPMVGHAVRKLVGAGIADVTLVTGPEDVGDFARLLRSGDDYLCDVTYRVQDAPGGVAQALLAAERSEDGRSVAVVLGDNIFEDQLGPILTRADRQAMCAFVCLKGVPDPSRYGVAEVLGGDIISVEEKPTAPRGDQAVTGVYFYPPDVFDVARSVRPSERGELEITDVNRAYLDRDLLRYARLDGYWIDAGTLEALERANEMVRQAPPRY